MGWTARPNLCAFALLLAALVLVVVGMHAEEASAENSSEKAGDGPRHCVSTVGAGEAQQPKMECFSTFRAAISDATGGRVADAPTNASELAADRALQKRIFAAPRESDAADSGRLSPMSVGGNDVVGCCNVLSVEYEHAGFRGNTLTYRIKGRPCDGDRGLEAAVVYVGDKWNDEISSYVGSGRCQVKHYQHRDYEGSSTRLKQQDNNMGVFNDETSSIKWG